MATVVTAGVEPANTPFKPPPPALHWAVVACLKNFRQLNTSDTFVKAQNKCFVTRGFAPRADGSWFRYNGSFESPETEKESNQFDICDLFNNFVDTSRLPADQDLTTDDLGADLVRFFSDVLWPDQS